MAVYKLQNPMAIKKEYLESIFKEEEKMEKIHKNKLPIILITSTFDSIMPKIKGIDVIFYLKNARNMNT